MPNQEKELDLSQFPGHRKALRIATQNPKKYNQHLPIRQLAAAVQEELTK